MEDKKQTPEVAPKRQYNYYFYDGNTVEKVTNDKYSCICLNEEKFDETFMNVRGDMKREVKREFNSLMMNNKLGYYDCGLVEYINMGDFQVRVKVDVENKEKREKKLIKDVKTFVRNIEPLLLKSDISLILITFLKHNQVFIMRDEELNKKMIKVSNYVSCIIMKELAESVTYMKYNKVINNRYLYIYDGKEIITCLKPDNSKKYEIEYLKTLKNKIRDIEDVYYKYLLDEFKNICKIVTRIINGIERFDYPEKEETQTGKLTMINNYGSLIYNFSRTLKLIYRNDFYTYNNLRKWLTSGDQIFICKDLEDNEHIKSLSEYLCSSIVEEIDEIIRIIEIEQIYKKIDTTRNVEYDDLIVW